MSGQDNDQDLNRRTADIAPGPLRNLPSPDVKQAIDQRVEDLSVVLANTILKDHDPDTYAELRQALLPVFCSGSLPAHGVDDSVIQELIDTFGRVTGHCFDLDKRQLLAKGVLALLHINDNDATRHDLNLIKNNVDLFLDNLQKALDQTLGAGNRRMLTRALVSVVGVRFLEHAGSE
jgi:hypothetical protein